MEGTRLWRQAGFPVSWATFQPTRLRADVLSLSVLVYKLTPKLLELLRVTSKVVPSRALVTSRAGSLQPAGFEGTALRRDSEESKPIDSILRGLSRRWLWLWTAVCVETGVPEFVPFVSGTAATPLGHSRVVFIVEGNSDLCWRLCRLVL